jgi:hypothetical protein
VLVVAHVPKLGRENATATMESSHSRHRIALRARNQTQEQAASVPICASLATS